MIDLSKLNPPETAPKDGSQVLAYATDVHGHGQNQPAEYPRWMIIQWADELPEGKRYWRWCVPGMSTRVDILGWMPLPWNDHWGQWTIDNGCAGTDSPQESEGAA